MENKADNTSLLEMPALAELIASAMVVERAAGEDLYQSGEPCNSLPLVISGNAKIYIRDKDGCQVDLYRLKPGDICPVSLSTLLQNSTYSATATAETAVQVRYLAGENFKTIISQAPEVFSVFLDTFSAGLSDSMRTVRRLISDPLDVPLNPLKNMINKRQQLNSHA